MSQNFELLSIQPAQNVTKIIQQEPLKAVEPSFLMEFHRCDSEYEVPDKQNDSEISSDYEFNQARHLKIVQEDGTEALRIDLRKNSKNFVSEHQLIED